MLWWSENVQLNWKRRFYPIFNRRIWDLIKKMILPCDQQKRPKAKWNVHSIKKVSFQLKTIFFQQNASVHLRNLITNCFLIQIWKRSMHLTFSKLQCISISFALCSRTFNISHVWDVKWWDSSECLLQLKHIWSSNFNWIN